MKDDIVARWLAAVITHGAVITTQRVGPTMPPALTIGGQGDPVHRTRGSASSPAGDDSLYLAIPTIIVALVLALLVVLIAYWRDRA